MEHPVSPAFGKWQRTGCSKYQFGLHGEFKASLDCNWSLVRAGLSAWNYFTIIIGTLLVLLLLLLIHFYVYKCVACKYICVHMHSWCLQMTEEGTGTWFTASCELPDMGAGSQTPRARLTLIIEPSLQPYFQELQCIRVFGKLQDSAIFCNPSVTRDETDAHGGKTQSSQPGLKAELSRFCFLWACVSGPGVHKSLHSGPESLLN